MICRVEEYVPEIDEDDKDIVEDDLSAASLSDDGE